MRDARLELRLTKDELAFWKEEAVKRGQTLSELVLEGTRFFLSVYKPGEPFSFGGERRQQAGAAAGSGLPERVTPPKPSKVRKCSHGVEAGYHCWQCHGKAIVVS